MAVQWVDAREAGEALIGQWQAQHQAMRDEVATWPVRPRVYFEEWDEPLISGIRWVSELVDLAGGVDVFEELGRQSLGKHRVIADPMEPVRRDPQLIVGSWCGKKFRPERVAQRPGWDAISAVRHGQLHEIKSPLILQPGPAALTEGVARLHALCRDWVRSAPIA